jgi:predicted patatin/cPLA2 family phospholipase
VSADSIPVEYAIRQGCSKLVAILTSNKGYRKKNSRKLFRNATPHTTRQWIWLKSWKTREGYNLAEEFIYRFMPRPGAG